jgi:N-methylhydantoinase B
MILTPDQVIDRSVIAHRLDTITKEMGYALERSSRSPIFAEACDFACGICDGKGNLVSQLSGIPILAAAGAFSVQAVIEKFQGNIRDEDVFIINDPYQGGNHLPDIGIISSLVLSNEQVFFCVSRAHHGDIGGSVAGSYNTKATEIFQEGLRIPPTKLISGGILNEDVMDLITRNVRNPEMMRNDLWAQIGANKIGLSRLADMIKDFSLERVKESTAMILSHAETLTKKAIAEMPDGVYYGEEWVDDDGFQEQPIKIAVTIEITGEEMTLDFAGTDPQVKGFVNTAKVTAMSAAWIGALWALGGDIPRNSGAFHSIRVLLPEGSLVNPLPPAPVTLSTLTPASEIISVIFRALASVAEKRLPAGFGRYCGPSFYGVDPRYQNFYIGFSFCSLGSGGGLLGKDGDPYMAPLSNYGGVRTPNIEANEVQYPHLTLCHEMEPDTAGTGQWRGGPGIRYSLQFYGDPTNIVMFGDGMKIPPFSLGKGSPGSLNRVHLTTPQGESIQMASKEPPLQIPSGTILTVVSSGGGGWGDPTQRSPKQVLQDVRNGIISNESARTDYGVALVEDEIVWSETEQLRKSK